MKFTPTDGKFSGQNGYGYRSFEDFIDACAKVNADKASPSDFDHKLASIATTYRTSAILDAGRKSLDNNKTIKILYEDPSHPTRPTSLS
jgi:D-galacturonate reductase